MADAWTVEVDRSLCMGSGMCTVYAPDSFVQDDETKAVFPGGSSADIEAVRSAIEACPTGALRLIQTSQES